MTTSADRQLQETRTPPPVRRDPGWRVVAAQECRDLWVSGRGLLLVFAVSVLLSAITYLTATNQVLNFLEQREAVNLTIQIAVAVGVLLTLIVSADGISG
jgi:ABC-2 type transport system permease protein